MGEIPVRVDKILLDDIAIQISLHAQRVLHRLPVGPAEQEDDPHGKVSDAAPRLSDDGAPTVVAGGTVDVHQQEHRGAVASSRRVYEVGEPVRVDGAVASHAGDIATHLIQRPVLGRVCQVELRVEFVERPQQLCVVEQQHRQIDVV